jgi:hypothetical protein
MCPLFISISITQKSDNINIRKVPLHRQRLPYTPTLLARLTRIVNRMLMSKSHEHPVMNAAAAGGKIIATITSKMSDPRAMVDVECQEGSAD